MMFKTKLITGVLCLLWMTQVRAQAPVDYIPEGATMVMSLNPQHLNQKVSLEELTQLAFYQDMIGSMAPMMGTSAADDIASFMNAPSEYGMDFMSNSYFVLDVNDTGSFFAYIFKISDYQKATQFLQKQTEGATDDSGFGMPPPTLMQADGFDYLQTASGTNLAWNNNIGVMVSGDVEYEYTEYTAEEFNEADSLQNIAIQDYLGALMQMPKGVENDQRFLKNTAASDVNFWIDYAYVQQQQFKNENLPEAWSGMGLELLFDQLMAFYEDTYLSMNLNFDKGVTRMETITYMDPAQTKRFSSALDVPLNKKLTKYIKGDDVLGYFALNYSVEKTVEAYKGMAHDMLLQMPFMGDMANTALEIIGIAIDEEALYNLIKGDMIFAVTGMKEVEREVVTYEYDEDFNETEVTKMVSSPMPMFTMVMSYGDRNNMMKFVRLGEQLGGLQPEGKHFKISNSELPMDMYLALENDILYLTNDHDMVTNHLQKGYKCKNRLSKDHIKTLKNSAATFFWDIPRTLDVAGALGGEMGFSENQILNLSKNTFENIRMTTDKTFDNGVYKGLIEFNFTNKEQNSLEQFFQYINDIYLSEMGGQL